MSQEPISPHLTMAHLASWSLSSHARRRLTLSPDESTWGSEAACAVWASVLSLQRRPKTRSFSPLVGTTLPSDQYREIFGHRLRKNTGVVEVHRTSLGPRKSMTRTRGAARAGSGGWCRQTEQMERRESKANFPSCSHKMCSIQFLHRAPNTLRTIRPASCHDQQDRMCFLTISDMRFDYTK